MNRKTGAQIQVFVWFFAALFTCAGVGSVWISMLSFESLKGIVLASIPPGYEDRFTPRLYADIIIALRILAFALAGLTLVLIRFAEPIHHALEQLVKDLMTLWNALGKAPATLKTDPLHTSALLAIMLWGICLRCFFLCEPVRKDEAYSFLYYGSRPTFVGLAYYTANNHPLNTLLMHISTLVFGRSEWAMRLPTLIAGILLVPATYAMVRISQGKNAALLAAALAAASSPLIEFSFNARGYSLGALFLLAMTIIIEAVCRRRWPGAWIYIGLLGALALYSVPTMLYGVAGVFLYMLVADSNRARSVLAIVLAGAFTLAFYTPALVTVGLSGIVRNKWTMPVPYGEWITQVTREIASLWVYWSLDEPRLIVGLIIAGALIALLPQTLNSMPAAAFLSILLVAAVVLPLQHVVPPRRTWLFLLPFYLGTSATGLNIIVQKIAGKKFELATAMLSLTLTLWMGVSVWNAKSLRHSGPESVGCRSAETVALAMRNRLAQGSQFICSDYCDSPIDFYMFEHRIHYSPTPNGELLIVTPHDLTPERTLDLAGIPRQDVLLRGLIGQYGESDVYVAQRTACLPFRPQGSPDMGFFTTIAH